MLFLWIFLGLAALVLLASYICYRIVFYNKPARPLAEGEYDIPHGRVYAPYHDQMIAWQKQLRQMPVEHFSIRSFDGLKLYGSFYEYAPGAVIELMFHGYRGTAHRDLCGGIHRAFSLGRSVFFGGSAYRQPQRRPHHHLRH